jgi:hypothetical protein
MNVANRVIRGKRIGNTDQLLARDAIQRSGFVKDVLAAVWQ